MQSECKVNAKRRYLQSLLLSKEIVQKKTKEHELVETLTFYRIRRCLQLMKHDSSCDIVRLSEDRVYNVQTHCEAYPGCLVSIVVESKVARMLRLALWSLNRFGPLYAISVKNQRYFYGLSLSIAIDHPQLPFSSIYSIKLTGAEATSAFKRFTTKASNRYLLYSSNDGTDLSRLRYMLSFQPVNRLPCERYSHKSRHR